MSPLLKASFLPFAKGVVDTGNPTLNLQGAVRAAAGFDFIGAGKLVTRSGTATKLTFKDDTGGFADVTSVCGVWQFRDKAVAIAHSTNTNKCYLYVLKSTLDDWYDGTTGALQGTTSPHAAAVIWSSITISPDVFVAEGLGSLYIAHAQGVDSAALNFATRSWNGAFAVALADLTADLDLAAGAETLYFNGCIAFQNHLWAWGFGSGAVVGTGYDPSKIRFSPPFFGLPFLPADSITIGNRTKSDRERIISAGIAGNALIVQGSYITSRITGYGRSSWFREIVDESTGIAGPKAGVSDGGYWYYWSLSKGPMRIAAAGPPDELFNEIPALVAAVINPAKIVAAREAGTNGKTNCIVFYVDTGNGVRTRVPYHTATGVWLSTSDDIGLAIKGAGEVAPVIASTAAGVVPPSGPPTSASTTSIGGTAATANWVNGDATAQTQVEHRLQGATDWTVDTIVAAGLTSYQITGLANLTAYEWRAAHVRSGQYSTYLGPVAGSQFTTTNQLLPPTNLGVTETSINLLHVTWTNSGESGVDTEVYVQDPSPPGYNLKATVTAGQAWADAAISAGAGTYLVKIRHVKSGMTPSNYAGPNAIAVT